MNRARVPRVRGTAAVAALFVSIVGCSEKAHETHEADRGDSFVWRRLFDWRQSSGRRATSGCTGSISRSRRRPRIRKPKRSRISGGLENSRPPAVAYHAPDNTFRTELTENRASCLHLCLNR